MESKDGKPAIHAKTRGEWRKWLMKHGDTQPSVWLILYHKTSQVKCINLEEATEEALCFGWIDSQTKKRDAESYYRTFTPRNPKSKWSPLNRIRAQKMIDAGKMTEAGQKLIDIAKSTGRWE